MDGPTCINLLKKTFKADRYNKHYIYPFFFKALYTNGQINNTLYHIRGGGTVMVIGFISFLIFLQFIFYLNNTFY